MDIKRIILGFVGRSPVGVAWRGTAHPGPAGQGITVPHASQRPLRHCLSTGTLGRVPVAGPRRYRNSRPRLFPPLLSTTGAVPVCARPVPFGCTEHGSMIDPYRLTVLRFVDVPTVINGPLLTVLAVIDQTRRYPPLTRRTPTAGQPSVHRYLSLRPRYLLLISARYDPTAVNPWVIPT